MAPIIRGNSLYTVAQGPYRDLSKQRAIQLGGNLASITSAEENSFVSDYLRTVSPANQDHFWWIGLDFNPQTKTFSWTSGEPFSYQDWYSDKDVSYPQISSYTSSMVGAEMTTDPYFTRNQTTGTGRWAIGDPNGYVRDGIAEIPLTLSITRQGNVKEGTGPFTTSINLSAGTQTSGNLAEGSQVWWRVTGITQDDLATGTLTGSGTITNGKLDIQHSLVADADTGEQFSVSVYSDSGLTQQIGTTSSALVQESPIVRGNSLYTIVGGPSWTQAEANSVALGGHLTAISSKAENDFLFNTFGPSPSPSSELWIGLNDAETEGTWKWSNGESVAFVNWANVAPANNVNIQYGANLGKETQDYVNFWWGTNNGTWDDYYNNDGTYDRKGIAETPFIRRGNSAYVIVQGPTWEEAEANAVKLGGHLVTINDASEQAFLSSAVPNENLWIGYTDSSQEGRWKWADGTTSLYTNWQPGEPNNQGGGENWALMYAGSRTWNDGYNKDHGLWLQRGIAEINLAPNSAPTGTPSITGTLKAGSTVTIDAFTIQDADNFTGYTPTYQYAWETSTDGTTWSKLTSTDATDNNTTYTLTSSEVGKKIRGVVSYLDGYGTNESIPTTASATITSQNQAPTDLTLSSSGITENSAGGTVIGTLSATDPDAGSTFTYALAAGNGTNDADNNLVTISGNQVLVKSGAAIDYETNPVLNINVQVTDNGGLTYTKALTTNVLDVNETVKPDPITGILDLPQRVRLAGKGLIPLTLYGSRNLNVGQIDPLTLRFGLSQNASVGIAPKGFKGELQISFADVNRDGFLDMRAKVLRTDLAKVMPRGSLDIDGFDRLKDGTDVTFGLAQGDSVVFF